MDRPARIVAFFSSRCDAPLLLVGGACAGCAVHVFSVEAFFPMPEGGSIREGVRRAREAAHVAAREHVGLAG